MWGVGQGQRGIERFTLALKTRDHGAGLLQRPEGAGSPQEPPEAGPASTLLLPQ